MRGNRRRLRAQAHEATALTLPGLESSDADRSVVRLADHVQAIITTVEQAGRPVVLVVDSGAGGPAHEVVDRVHDAITAMVYVDTGAATGPLDPDLEGAELPLPPPDELAAEKNLEGLTPAHLVRFRAQAVPQPAATVRQGPSLRGTARLDVPRRWCAPGSPRRPTAPQWRRASPSSPAWPTSTT